MKPVNLLILSLLLFQSIRSKTIAYTGILFYNNSGSKIPFSLYTNDDCSIIRIDYLRDLNYVSKTYYNNTEIIKTLDDCITNELDLNYKLILDYSNKIPIMLNETDSRSLSLILTGSWYNKESLYVMTCTNYNINIFSKQYNWEADIYVNNNIDNNLIVDRC